MNLFEVKKYVAHNELVLFSGDYWNRFYLYPSHLHKYKRRRLGY